MKIIESSADFDGEAKIGESVLARLPSVHALEEQQRNEVNQEQDLLRQLQMNLQAGREAERTGAPIQLPFDPRTLESQLSKQIRTVAAQQEKVRKTLRQLQSIQYRRDETASRATTPGTSSPKDQIEFLRRLQPELAQRMVVLRQNCLAQNAGYDRSSNTYINMPLSSTSTTNSLHSNSHRAGVQGITTESNGIISLATGEDVDYEEFDNEDVDYEDIGYEDVNYEEPPAYRGRWGARREWDAPG